MANTTGISAQFNNGAVSTMSSREIADIAEARHNDVVATIDRLFDKGLLRSSRKSRHENTGGRPIEVYDLVNTAPSDHQHHTSPPTAGFFNSDTWR